MTQDEKIREVIKRLSGSSSAPVMLVCTVKEISDDKTYVSAEVSDGLVLEEVRLRSIIGGDKGSYVVPKVGSKILALKIGASDDFYCVATEEATNVLIKFGNTSLEVNDESIIFNNNELSSYALDINKLKGKINAIEQQLNDLKAVFRDWTPVAQDGGAKLKLGSSTWASTDIVKTTVDDIKDPKIKN